MDFNIPSAQSHSGRPSPQRRTARKRMIASLPGAPCFNSAKVNRWRRSRSFGPSCLGVFLFCLSVIPIKAQAQLRNIQNIFDPLSRPAELIKETAVLTLLVCLGIFLIVSALLFYSVWRYRRRPTDDETQEPPQVYGSTAIELAWTVPPILIVVLLVLATARTIGEIKNVKYPDDALQVRVIGHRFWWEIRYPKSNVVTANEIHVPVSYLSTPHPIKLNLESVDVVHGFWIPQLNGKSWVVPNENNSLWIQPTQRGIYLGNCTVFCGPQHANMLIRVIVDSPDDFDKWIAEQQKAPVPAPSVEEGTKAFIASSCGSCHRIEGTTANGVFGPDLTHYMSRETLGSGVAPNTDENIRTWLKDPQILKEGCLMPNMKLDDKEVDQILAYLKTLK
jgi:cytochrome c oxidase subunit II